MKRKFTIIFLLVALMFGTSKAQIVFDPATIDTTGWGPGKWIDELDGSKYMAAIVDHWNVSINLPGVVILPKYTKYKIESKYSVGPSSVLTVDEIVSYIKFADPSWAELQWTQEDATADFSTRSAIMGTPAPGIAVGVLQFGGRKKDGEATLEGDTIWIGRITIDNPYVVMDPITVDTAAIPDSWAVTEVDGVPYFKMIVDGWNGAAWWSIPNFTVPSEMKNLRYYSKYALGGQHSYTEEQVNTWADWIGGGSNLTITQASSSELQKFSGDLTLSEINQLQLVGQDNVVWGTVAGDTVYMSAPEPDWPHSLQIMGEGGATSIDTDLGNLQLFSNGLPAGTDSSTVTWYVSDPNLATVSETGLVDAFYDGVVKVAATSDDPYGATDTIEITLSNQVTGRIEVASIVVSNWESTDVIDEKDGFLRMKAEVLPVDAFDPTFTWSVSPDSIATITQFGRLTATANGVATVMAKANDDGGVEGTMEITISNQAWVESITVTSEGDVTAIDTKGGTLQLYVDHMPKSADDSTFTWELYPAGLASVDENNLLTAMGDGVVNVWAMANDGSGVGGSIALTISNQIRVATITVMGDGSISEIPIAAGTLQMVATLEPSNASVTDVTWDVNDPAIATISATGLLTAVGNGTATVTATSVDPDGASGSTDILISGQAISVEDLDGNAIVAYPNPAKNTLTIENAGSFESFEIVNLDGRLMMRVQNNSNEISIDVSGLRSGVYSVRAYQGKQIHTFKLVKE